MITYIQTTGMLVFRLTHFPEPYMKHITASEIAAMPVKDRIQLVEDIWDSIAELPESVTLPDWHKKELEARLKAYHANPESGSPWADVKKRIMG